MGLFSRIGKRPPEVAAGPPVPTFNVRSPTNNGAWFKYADHAPALSAQQWCGLALGQVQSVAWDLPVNTLSTFIGRADSAQGLANGWGITSQQDAQRELALLLAAGADDDLGQVRDWPQTRGVLVEAGMLDQVEGQLPSVAAWDLSRVTMVTRMSFEAGYLGEEEAWGWIGAAAESSVAAYESIVEFGDAFVVGRVCWTMIAYTGEDAAQIVPEAKEFAAALVHLAQDEDSPWRTVPWPSAQR